MKTKKLGKKLHDLFVDLEQHDANHFVPVPASFTVMRPGNTIIFYYQNPAWGGYPEGYRFGMVVRNTLGQVGYTTTQGNRVLSVIKLDDLPSAVVKFMIKRFYNRRLPSHHLASYKNIKSGLIALTGKSNYHTYMLNKMTQIHKVYLDKKILKYYGDEFEKEFDLSLIEEEGH